MVLFESPIFTRYRDAYLTDDEYLRLQLALISQPTSGSVVPDQIQTLRKLVETELK